MTEQAAIDAYIQGEVLAFPTEAVFGLGCDPLNEAALLKLLEIKNRPKNKGLILLAANLEQLDPFIDLTTLTQQQQEKMLAKWPDGITQVVPVKSGVSDLLSGQFSTIAVRLTSQPDVVALCNAVGKPIVSTSANLSGKEPAKTWQSLDPQLVKQLGYVIKGKTLGFSSPSTIVNAISGETYRP